MTDPISDMLNRIKTAYAVKKAEIRLPASKLKLEVAKVLVDRKFIEKVSLETEPRPTLVIQLRYQDGNPAMKEIKRLSKPGQRRYVANSEIPRVRGGLGTVIISTSKGLKTGEAARREGIGGEILCEVY